MTEFMAFREYFLDQLLNADCDGVKQALNDRLEILESYRDVEEGFLSATVFFAEKMLIHTRLARIHKALKYQGEARYHMKLAKEACVQRGWEDCTEDYLIQHSKRLEGNHPITCLLGLEEK